MAKERNQITEKQATIHDEDEDDEILPPGYSPTSPKKSFTVRDFLREQSKEELLALLDEIVRDYPEIRQRLEDRHTLESGKPRQMLEAVRQEISALGDINWDHHGYGSHSADLGRLEQHLEALAKAGQADAIIRLGRELLTAGGRAVEQEDEGESGYELGGCLAVIFQALPQSSLSPVEQLEWAIDMSLVDEYGLCDTSLARFWQIEYDKVAWSELADRLQQRLEGFDPAASSRNESPHHYHRDRLSNQLIKALDKAGRQDEILPLCEREAPLTHSYRRLVEHLIAAKRWQKAESWCLKGIEDADSKSPGISRHLREQLCTIHEQTGNPLRAAAMVADTFFSSPSLSTFQELCQAARKVNAGEAVEAWARYYLETGTRPQSTGSGNSRPPQQDAPFLDWPLPASGVPQESRRWVLQTPVVQVLIEIAMHEKKPDEVLKWFDHPGHGSERLRTAGQFDARVAQAVKDAYPDRSIAIWKSIAEGYIAQTQVKSYQTAGTYLALLRDLMVEKHRKEEWETYLKELHEKNRRKPRCVEVLDRLASQNRRVIDN